jgi:DNA-nicking Smr family endonuclease
MDINTSAVVNRDDAQFDDHVAVLAEMFPEKGMEQIMRVLLHNENDLQRSILDLASLASHHDIVMEEPALEEQLAGLFPDVPLDYLHDFVLSNQGGQQSQSTDDWLTDLGEQLLQQLVAMHQSRSKGVPHHQKRTYIPLTRPLTRPSTPHSYREALSTPICLDKPTCESPQYHRSTINQFGFDFGCEGVPDESSAAYRQQAANLLEQRNRLYQRASHHYRQGPREAAPYYATRAAKLTHDIRQLERRAAYAAFLEHNPQFHPSSSDHKHTDRGRRTHLDLHGLTVDEGVAVVSAFLRFHQPSHQPLRAVRMSVKTLQITTGSGNRRPRYTVRLRPAIFHLLSHLDLDFYLDDGNGAFMVQVPK